MYLYSLTRLSMCLNCVRQKAVRARGVIKLSIQLVEFTPGAFVCVLVLL